MKQQQTTKCAARASKSATEPWNQLTVKEMVKALREAYRDVDLKTMKREELCRLYAKHLSKVSKMSKVKKNKSTSPTPLPSPLRLIRYDGANSCYLDSTLMALLHTKAISRYLLTTKGTREITLPSAKAIYDALVTMSADIKNHDNRDGLKCTHIRRLFQRFDQEYKRANKVQYEHIEWLRTQQEPRDVIDILIRALNMRPNVKTLHYSEVTEVTEVTKATEGKGEREKRTAYFNAPYLDAGLLYENRRTGILLKDHLPKSTMIVPDGRRIVTEYTHARLLVVNIGRNWLDEEKLTTSVTPLASVTLKDTNVLSLVSVIIHNGRSPTSGHYTCMLNIKGKWHYYDDLERDLQPIGSFGDMLRWRHGLVLRNAVTFVYGDSTNQAILV
jgi:hypothetical protein